MTPKEKAKELVEKYYHLFSVELENTIDLREAKQCALIAVDEVRNFHDSLFYATKGSLLDKYLDEVKQEIEKI